MEELERRCGELRAALGEALAAASDYGGLARRLGTGRQAGSSGGWRRPPSGGAAGWRWPASCWTGCGTCPRAPAGSAGRPR